MIRKTQLLIIPILIILICVIFYPVIFQGKVFSSPDSLNPKAASIILEKSLQETGEYPMWQPWIFSGMPTTESFTNTSRLYFPQYLFTLLHFPSNIVHLLHFLFAGIGVYVLLRYLKISQYVAMISASGFMLIPYLVTMEVFGHGSQAMTAAYIPWAFWVALRMFDRIKITDAGLLAIILGFQLQRAHVQIAYYTWMLISALFLFKIIFYIIDGQNRIKAAKITGLFFTVILLALGISALIYLPSLQYSSESIRSVGQSGSASYNYATSWSFHPKEMLTFLLPSAYGFGGQTYWGAMPFTDYPNYMGIIFLIFAIVALIKNRNKLVWFLLVTTLLALLISFGSHFNIVYNLFYNFAPYFNKFRIPSMILILVQFNIIVLAAFGLDKIINLDLNHLPKWFWWLTGSVGVFVLLLLFGNSLIRDIIAQGFTQPRTQDSRYINLINNLRWKLWYRDAWLLVVFVAGLLGSIFLLIKGKTTKHIFIVLIGCISIFDIALVDYKIVQPNDESGRSSQLVLKRAIDRYFDKDPITTYLMNIKENNRVYPIGKLFGESRLQAFGIESVGGYHPAKLAIYNRFLQNTNNISTLPLMRMMNVHYILSPQVINHPELKLVFTENMPTNSGRIPIWIYELNNHLKRAWFVEEIEIEKSEDLWSKLMDESFDPLKTAYINKEIGNLNFGSGKVISSEYKPNYIRLEVRSEQEGYLVISEVFYPLRWQAFIDGEKVSTIETNGIIRGLVIPPGEHIVEFMYDKSIFNKGIKISIMSLLIALSLVFIGFVKFKK